MKFYRQKKLCALALASLLTACSTVSAPPPTSIPKKIATPAVTPLPSAQDLAQAKRICDQLRAQFQTQLPAPILALMHWQIQTIHDPMRTQGPLYAACQIGLATNGATIEQLGLTPSFISALFERLDWQSDLALNGYAADSPTAHQEAMRTQHNIAYINQQFAPPQGACPANQPLAGCKVSKKSWQYQLSVRIVGVA